MASRARSPKKPTAAVLKPKKRINSRNKGASAERELANLLKERGYDAARGQQHKGGTDSPDVTGLPGFHIECKRVQSGNLYNWLAQAIKDAGPEKVPVVVHRKNGKRWVAILDFDAFLNLLIYHPL